LSSRSKFIVIGTIVVVVVGVVVVLATRWVPGIPSAAPAGGPTAPPVPKVQLYVSPTGNDSNDGSANAPLRTIQAGIEKAMPGTAINLAPGEYREQLQSWRDGTPDAPITIKGPETGKDKSGRYKAVVYGTGRVFSIDHSYITLDGFTIDGQEELAKTPFPTDLGAMDAFKTSVQSKVEDGRLIYVGAGDTTRDVTGVTINNMFLNGAGGECVRLRNNAHDNTITDSVIQYCGMFGKKSDNGKRAEFHNGEGVYIGTSPKSDSQPMHENDGSSRNVVARNTIRTFGSECFNIKENAHDNVFEDNICSDNTESSEFEGSNIELRGHANIVRNNQISNSAGVSVKIRSDSEKYDKGGNVVENNRISGSVAALMWGSDAAPGKMCGNTVSSTQTQVDVDGDAKPPGDITAPC
jgi:hypothetical protein